MALGVTSPETVSVSVSVSVSVILVLRAGRPPLSPQSLSLLLTVMTLPAGGDMSEEFVLEGALMLAVASLGIVLNVIRRGQS